MLWSRQDVSRDHTRLVVEQSIDQCRSRRRACTVHGSLRACFVPDISRLDMKAHPQLRSSLSTIDL